MSPRLTRLIAPASPLLTLVEARAACRIDDGVTEEDSLLLGMVETATAYLDARDGVLGEALVTQTWRATWSEAPAGSVALPLGPARSIVAIGYVDPAGATQVVSPAAYRLSGEVVELVSGASWPAVDGREAAFWIDYTAGYGLPSEVPATVRRLASLMVSSMFRNRDAEAEAREAKFSAIYQSLFGAARSARGLF